MAEAISRAADRAEAQINSQARKDKAASKQRQQEQEAGKAEQQRQKKVSLCIVSISQSPSQTSSSQSRGWRRCSECLTVLSRSCWLTICPRSSSTKVIVRRALGYIFSADMVGVTQEREVLEAQKRDRWVPKVGSMIFVPRLKGNFKV